MELCVANMIHKAGYCSPRKKEGPDFCIKINDHNLHIECVCFGDGKDNVKQDCIKETAYINGERVDTKGGIDTRIVEKMHSSIKDKAEKVLKYKEKNIIKPNDKIILVMSRIADYAQPENTNYSNTFYDQEFDEVMKGPFCDSWKCNPKETPLRFEYENEYDPGKIAFEKDEKLPQKVKDLEENRLAFDVIICIISPCFFPMIKINKDLDENDKEILEKIFNGKRI